jgi:hypothetical protein
MEGALRGLVVDTMNSRHSIHPAFPYFLEPESNVLFRQVLHGNPGYAEPSLLESYHHPRSIGRVHGMDEDRSFRRHEVYDLGRDVASGKKKIVIGRYLVPEVMVEHDAGKVFGAPFQYSQSSSGASGVHEPDILRQPGPDCIDTAVIVFDEQYSQHEISSLKNILRINE